MSNKFRSLINRFLFDYKRNAHRRKIVWDLTKTEFIDLVSGDCAYCGAKPDHRECTTSGSAIKGGGRERVKVKSLEKLNGIDRKDNSVGYTLANCVPCCMACNFLKRMFSAERFIDHVLKIAMHKGLK